MSYNDDFGTDMTILARRFTILCLAMSVFAVGLTMVVQKSDRRGRVDAIWLSAPCPQPAGIHCRAAL
jgi:hypothetical protein